MQQLGDIGQRIHMFLELALRHQKEHHQADELTVHRVKSNCFLRAANRHNHFANQIGRGVREADAESD